MVSTHHQETHRCRCQRRCPLGNGKPARRPAFTRDLVEPTLRFELRTCCLRTPRSAPAGTVAIRCAAAARRSARPA